LSVRFHEGNRDTSAVHLMLASAAV
jgi:hypothetical protein